MTNDDVLRTVRHALSLDDAKSVALFALSDIEVAAEDLATMTVSDAQLAGFLDGLILDRRGPRKPGAPVPDPDAELTRNAVFKKLRIALSLQEQDVLSVLNYGGATLNKHELTALFRKPGHKHYKKCKEEVLDAFLKGLTLRFHRADDA